MSNESENVKKKKKSKPIRDVNGYWMKGSNGGHTGRVPLIWTEEKLDQLAEDLIIWVDENVKEKKAYLLGDWCYKVKMIPQEVPKYVVRSEKFKHADHYAKGWQEHMLCKGALHKKLDAGMAKFMLSCTHGWSPAQHIEDEAKVLRNDFAQFNDNMKDFQQAVANEDESA